MYVLTSYVRTYGQADEDSAAHHDVVDASDIVIDAGLACAGLLEDCDADTPCCSGEDYYLSNILTPIIFICSVNILACLIFICLIFIICLTSPRHYLCFRSGIVCYTFYGWCMY